MEKSSCFYTLFFVFTSRVILSSAELQAQEAQHAAEQTSASLFNISNWFGIIELPFLLIAVIFGFLTASALKGGIFGRGMSLAAWGFLVMAVGHLHMQVEHFFHLNLFAEIFGNAVGGLVWAIALIITWTLSGLGFYSIYKASKGR